MFVYEGKMQLRPEGMSTGDLFRLFQEAAGAQSQLLGCGEDDMTEKGVMWVVIRYYVKVSRWPQGGDRMWLQTWPGQSRHGMCPRFYKIRDENGQEMISASALWAVVDRESRKMVLPAERGVYMEPIVTGEEERLPPAPKKHAAEHSRTFTVPAVFLDVNGHMNNTRYYDLVEHLLGAEIAGKELREVVTEFSSEAREGDRMQISWASEGDTWYVEGASETTNYFRMNLNYAE